MQVTSVLLVGVQRILIFEVPQDGPDRENLEFCTFEVKQRQHFAGIHSKVSLKLNCSLSYRT